MNGRLPRIVVAAPGTGQGKTTVATGLMAALRARGLTVSGHKVGPDYIDPGYHALACGRPGRNLDPHLVGEQRIVSLLRHGAAGADVAVVEGVMGLFDGRVGSNGFASTAHVAALTHSPIVLVIDISRASRTVGAVAHGLATYDPDVRVAGVILNQAGSPRHAAEVASSVRLPVLGTLPRDPGLATPSRHLGLVTAAEREASAELVALLAARITETVDLDAVLDVAGTAPDLDAEPWSPADEVVAASDRRPVVAMAAGRAFTFRYAETLELLEAAGCEVVTFDPMSDAALPRGTAGLYLGGGFPEEHAAALTANSSLLAEVRNAVRDGVPTVAECAGLLYLCRTLDETPMVGAIEADARMVGLTLRYPTATVASDGLLTRAGEQVNGHEFHHTAIEPVTGLEPAWMVDGDPVGFGSATLHASYLHTHWAGHPVLAQRFADAVHGVVGLRDPLRHHGDAEIGPGLLDLAVNTYPAPRPAWLDDALRASLDDVGAYPDPRAAEAATARFHGRHDNEVLATAGAAEAFSLMARRPWRRPVVVHPQFTEPHAALEQAGHRVTAVVLPRPFVLDPGLVPEDADLVVIGNPTNPTGVLHPASTLLSLRRPGRLVVVDEAFMDTVPGETESVLADAGEGLLVVRSLTKHWSIPGVRAGYVVGDAELLTELRRAQVPWSVSSAAMAALTTLATDRAREEGRRRADQITAWRERLHQGLANLGVDHVVSSTSFVLARVGEGMHTRLRTAGIAVRRADTFPGLDGGWVRIAVRADAVQRTVLTALSDALG